MTMTAAELVASKKHILLDFDGPICAAFAGYGAANISRHLATLLAQEGYDVPAELFSSRDPFELLRYAASQGDLSLLAEVDVEFRRLETLAVQLAPPTAGALKAIEELNLQGHILSIVSNNSIDAVQSYVAQHQLSRYLATVSARSDSDPSLLKPNPALIEFTLAENGCQRDDAVMIGDSVSDIQAAREARVSAIAFINKPNKAEALAGLADASIRSMLDIIPNSCRREL